MLHHAGCKGEQKGLWDVEGMREGVDERLCGFHGKNWMNQHKQAL